MSYPIRFPEPDVFRVDPKAKQKLMEEELKKKIAEQMSLIELSKSRSITQKFIPSIMSFSKSSGVESLAVGSGNSDGETLIYYESVPGNFIGFLQSMSLSPVGGVPGTWFRVLVDDEPIDGFTGSNGKIEISVGTFVNPRPLIPPIVIYDDLKVYAGNTTTASWTAGFSCEGIHVQKPPIFDKQSPIVSISTLRDLVRFQGK